MTCCSQFAVRRETIRLRPRAEYVRFREWLLVSPLGDDLSGRVLEYSWHGKEPLFYFPYPSEPVLIRNSSSHLRQEGSPLP